MGQDHKRECNSSCVTVPRGVIGTGESFCPQDTVTGSHSVRGVTVSSDTGRATRIFLAAICDTLRSNKLSVEQAVGVCHDKFGPP